MTPDVLTRVADLSNLEADWQRLGRRFPTPLLQHDWFLTCAELLHEEADLRVITIRRDGVVVALAPLVLVQSKVATWLEILGSSRLHEPAGLLYEDSDALDALVDAILALRYPVLLQRVALESPIVKSFRGRRSLRAWVLVRQTGASCYLPLGDNWDAFFESLGAKWRSGFRSKERKARAVGPISIEECRPSPQELAGQLDLAFAIEAASWKGRNDSSLLHNHRLRQFFQRYAERAIRVGTLRLFFYRIGNEAIAMRLAVEFGRRLWFLKTGYNDAWARLSPGMQLTLEMIRRSMQSGLEACEFLGADEPWQHAWPVGTHRYCAVIAYPTSLRGVQGALDTVLTVARTRLTRSRAPRRRPSKITTQAAA
jgi:CelD/BcsL family acetyltransferase involved in cellulose biosynthesis